MNRFCLRFFCCLFVTTTALFLVGCASTAPLSSPPNGMGYHRDKDIQNVWLASQFDFNGYDVLYIAQTQAELSKTNKPDEAEMLEWAKGDLRSELIEKIQAKKVFGLVTANRFDIKPGTQIIVLENTIIEYAKGNGAARFWAGEFGAGQPVIRVHGTMMDGTNTVFMFESYRSGDSASARLDPGWTAEKSLQTLDIDDLAGDTADFIEQVSKHQPRK